MKIPKKIKILGHYIDIIVQNRLNEAGTNKLGTDVGSMNKIFINSDQAASQQESTLLHEIIENINWQLNLGFEEKTICQLEAALYQVLKDNLLKL